jgi:hypothetical protein
VPYNADHLCGVADISASSANVGEIRCNLGDSVTGDGYAAECAIWGPPGFIGRPADPTTGTGGGACQALYVVEGNQKRVVATRDNRITGALPQLKPGESMQYGPHAGQFIRCDFDGGISIYTTTEDGSPDGRGIYTKYSPTNGVDTSTPWGRQQIGPNGCHLQTSGGASLRMGSIQGLPAPLDGLGTYAKLQADMVSIKAAVLSLGSDGGVANEAAVTTLGLLILQLIAAIAAITPGTTNGGTAALTSVGLDPAAITALIASLPATLAPIGKVV